MISRHILLLALAYGAPELELMRLFDFRDRAQIDAWRPIHDRVMGGVSSGVARPGEDTIRFEGTVSLDNNGGFASFRAPAPAADLTDADGLRLRARGDGRIYKLSLRTDGAWDGVGWQASFATTADEWTTIDVAFEDLQPTWRGRFVADAPPFDPSRLRQLGIVIADEQAGPFALEVASIDAWSASRPDAAPAGTTVDARSAARRRTDRLAAALDDEADGERLTGLLRWEERLLVVATPGDLDSAASRQLGRLIARRDELVARELRLVTLMGERAGRIAGRTLAPHHVRELRRTWELPAARWSVALVGKDGDVKERWASIVDPAEIFAAIDAMPMRRREVAERNDR